MIVLFVLELLVICWQIPLDCVISGKGNLKICVFQQFCDKSCFVYQNRATVIHIFYRTYGNSRVHSPRAPKCPGD